MAHIDLHFTLSLTMTVHGIRSRAVSGAQAPLGSKPAQGRGECTDSTEREASSHQQASGGQL